ncbi:MAG: putative bifunctional diguanylate cyclase/phosphodiesterase [Pontibacterium sp.]
MKQSNPAISRQIIRDYPKGDVTWLAFATGCVALACAGGGVVTLDLSGRDTSDDLRTRKQIHKHLHILTCNLRFECPDVMVAPETACLNVHIFPSLASLADGRFYLHEKGENRLLTGSEISRLLKPPVVATGAVQRGEGLELHRDMLALMVREVPVTEILSRLADRIETLIPDIIVSVLEVDSSGFVHHAAGNSLPDNYITAIDGLCIGPDAGSCGTAAWRREVVICEDIASDPLWKDFKELALGSGLRACWSVPLMDADGTVLGTFAVYRQQPGAPDAEEKQLIQYFSSLVLILLRHKASDEEQLRLKRGLELSPVPLLMINARGLITMANTALCALLDYQNESLVGRDASLLHSSSTSSETYRELWTVVRAGRCWQGELVVCSRTGEKILIELTVTPILNAKHQPGHYVLQIQDLRERHAAAQELERLAFYDVTTGLPNRALLQDRLGIALANKREHRRFGALFFIDLDHFKRVNDVYGHGHGDAVLRACAERLGEVLRKEDTLARMGGDEFVALLSGLSSNRSVAARRATNIAEKMRLSLEQPLCIKGHQHYLGASVGVTLFPKALESAEDLLREADTAMYEAKSSGRNTVSVFDPIMHRAVSERYQIESELRLALESGEFELFLQPQVDIDGNWCAAEALIRWHHPVRGLLLPSEFIPVAEDSGQIASIGRWVLRQVCILLSRCEAMGKPLTIAANVSTYQIHDAGFVATVKESLQATGADPSRLTLEITETLLLEDAVTTANVINELVALGINFSIDDFGTGYSNLSYLRRLPLCELKIDQSFVRDICDDANDASVVEAILGLARHLGLSVVAEGVETQAHVRFLTRHHCQRMQGYFFGMPRPINEFLNHWSGNQSSQNRQK